MKRAKRLYILLGVLAVLSVAAIAVIQREEHKEKIKDSGETILQIPYEGVTALSWENESESLSFYKGEDGVWTYDEDEKFPVSEEKIKELLEPFEEFAAAFVIEEVEDYSQYGLDDPVCTIHVENGEQELEIKLGNFSNMDSQRYVSIGDGKAYLVKDDPLNYFDAVLKDMLKQDEIPELETVSSLRFTGPETYEAVRIEDSGASYSSEDVYFKKDEENLLPLDPVQVDEYIRTLQNLDLSDYASYYVSEEEWSTYGLDAPELSLEADYTFENEDKENVSGTLTVSVSRDPKEKEKAEKKENSEENSGEEEEITAYARVNNSQIAYKLTAEDYKGLMAMKYDDLRHKEVFWGDTEEITGIDISLEGADYSLTSKGKKDDRTWTYQEEEIETDELFSALKGLKADCFTEEEPGQKEEIRLTLHLDNEVSPQVTIVLYRYDGSSCLAEADGKTVSLIPRSQAVDLIEAVNTIVLGNTED